MPILFKGEFSLKIVKILKKRFIKIFKKIIKKYYKSAHIQKPYSGIVWPFAKTYSLFLQLVKPEKMV